MAHASDWYRTIVEGVAGSTVPPNTGPRPLDGFNLLPAIFGAQPSPRNEIVSQVNNSYFSENVSVIRRGDLKLIRGPPGDNRTIAWPQPAPQPVPLGLSGAVVEPGTDHVRAPVLGGVVEGRCAPWCLYNLTADLGESHNLAHDGPPFHALAVELAAALDAAGATGPPPAYIWPDPDAFAAANRAMCVRAKATGTIQPLDW